MQITSLHAERGRQMRQLVQHDIATRGLSFEAAVESLAEYLGIEAESVKLGIAIANASVADGRGGWVVSAEHGPVAR